MGERGNRNDFISTQALLESNMVIICIYIATNLKRFVFNKVPFEHKQWFTF